MPTKAGRVDDELVETVPLARPVAVFRHVMTAAPDAGAYPSEADATEAAAGPEISVTLEAPTPSAIFRHAQPPGDAADGAPASTNDPDPATRGAPARSARGAALFPFAPGIETATHGLVALSDRAFEVFNASVKINMDYAARFFRATSLPNLLDLQSQWFRKQAETLLSQAGDLGASRRNPLASECGPATADVAGNGPGAAK